ncbi:toll/interleukin-1 receptor domain-containing protein [Saccharothrix violaceirubra]|uniref:Outer membrane protein assembly factor BamB n=1 Tax=Saccharothrix violaceirubra TaxID=413306 RepID=A0A7W7T4M9_9PSEU|nr:toll/interleukin-1 receptor domain-containing protein [Saccharothrix violaceirubra]MBB4966442.1 outer membrane protein assembly factor BamB [Saccharothrix violaceirubra]
MDEVRYDVALSYASADRAVAEEIAGRLTALGHRVFYDQARQAELWGTELPVVLERIYGRESRYCVVLVSRHYVESVWAREEFRSALAGALFGPDRADSVLPLRLDDTALPGLRPTVAYLDHRRLGTDAVVRLLLEKLGTSVEAAAHRFPRRRVLGYGLGLVAAAGGVYAAGRWSSTGPGTQRWHRHFTSACNPLVDSGNVYLALDDGSVVALNAADGAQRWRADMKGEMVLRCSVVEGLVLVAVTAGQDRGRLTALDADGEVRWTLDTEGWPWTQCPARDGRVYLGTASGWLYAVDRLTGKPGHAARLTAQVDEIAVALDAVYVATLTDGVLVLAESGEARWSRPAPTAVPGLAVDDDRLHYTVGGDPRAGKGGQVRTVGARDGEPLWTHDFDTLIQVGPTVARGRLLVPDLRGTLHCLEASTGKVLWQQDVDADLTNRVTVDGDVLYVGTRRGLAVLGLDTGEIRWSRDIVTTPPNDRYSAARPVLDDDSVYLGYGDATTSSGDGDVYAFSR